MRIEVKGTRRRGQTYDEYWWEDTEISLIVEDDKPYVTIMEYGIRPMRIKKSDLKKILEIL